MRYEINDDIYPFSSVVFIGAWGDHFAVSSGALIGPNDVVTASHNIYDKARGGLADEVYVWPSYDPDDGGVSGQTSYEPYAIKYFANFDPEGDGIPNPAGTGDILEGIELDIALLSLNDNVGNINGYFGVILILNMALLSVIR